MMRILLAGILILLPLIAQAEPLDCLGVEIERCVDPSSLIELEVYQNPYSPASPTNFEALIGPYLYVQGRQGNVLYLQVDHGYAHPFRQSEVSHLSLGKSPGRTTTSR